VSAPGVIVSGMIAATQRQGGAAWAVLQYLLGMRRLGCEVWFVEPVDDPPRSAPWCREVLGAFDLEDRWALVGSAGGEPAGMSRGKLRAAARDAEVLVNVSGMLQDADVLDQVPSRVYLDLDPAFVQLWHAVQGVDMRLDAHTHFVSVSDAIGTAGCPIPTCGREWTATLPPVVLDHWPVADGVVYDALTTVGHWRSYGSVEYEGLHYGQKAHALRPLMDLPRRAGARLAPALAIDPGEVDDLEALRANDWELLDPAALAATPGDYRDFVQGSWAELGIAKSGYVVSNSGWFSDRSACYLASGRPVIAQDTGFARRLPTGAGLFAFADADDVAAAVDELHADYERHRGAAREIARAHLDSDHVLGALLETTCR
jgi:hypothetical protein